MVACPYKVEKNGVLFYSKTIIKVA